ncbi:MAG: glycosyltransferase family 39 protein [Pseudomonadota bacterium]
MATTNMSAVGADTNRYAQTLLLIVLGVVVARLVVVAFTPLDLFYDEAQYWYWGEHPALGYFSKPPLIGWLIAASTAICGDTEACIRAPAAMFHGLTTLLVFGLTRSLYEERTAFFSALAYLFAIGISASSLIMSTDVPLLFCWVTGLWAFARYRQTPSLVLALGFGLAVAIGLNAKYAMIYFPLCLLLYLALTAEKRALLKRGDLWVGIGVGLLGFVPNLIWNIQNDFITFAHTGTNISGGGITFNPLSFLEFVGSQFGVAGPIILIAALLTLVWRWTSDKPETDRFLWIFSLPILGLLSLQAFQSSANYNWAATAFPSLVIVTTAILIHKAQFKWVRWNLITCAVVAGLLGSAALAVLLVRPDNPIVSRTNLEDMYGWAEHADVIGNRLDALEADTIVTVGRRYAAGFSFYLKDRGEDIRAFRREGAPPQNHFELTVPWAEPAPGERAVIISPANITPLSSARLVGVVEADEGEAVFRSNSYLFLAVGPEEQALE